MKRFKYILGTCRSMLVLTTLTALVSGACNAALLAVVNAALHGPGPGRVSVGGWMIGTFVGGISEL